MAGVSTLGDMRRQTTGSRRAHLTTVAGWAALTYGALHVVVVPLRRRENLSQVWAEGVVWSAHQRRRVPGWLGGIVLAWGLPFVTALPASPGRALPVIGGLIIAGDTDGRGPEPGAGEEAGREAA